MHCYSHLSAVQAPQEDTYLRYDMQSGLQACPYMCTMFLLSSPQPSRRCHLIPPLTLGRSGEWGSLWCFYVLDSLTERRALACRYDTGEPDSVAGRLSLVFSSASVPHQTVCADQNLHAYLSQHSVSAGQGAELFFIPVRQHLRGNWSQCWRPSTDYVCAGVHR